MGQRVSVQSASMLWWGWLLVALVSAWQEASAGEPTPPGAVVVARYVADGRGPRVVPELSQRVLGARAASIDLRWREGGWELVRRAVGRSQCLAERIRLVHHGADLVAWPGRSEVTVCEGRACGLCEPVAQGCDCLRKVPEVGTPACASRTSIPRDPDAFVRLVAPAVSLVAP